MGVPMRWRWVLIGVGGPLLLAASGVIFYHATLYPAGPPQRGTLALVGATVLTGPELGPQPDATVLIRDGVIIEVGPAGTVPVPSDATVVDLRGYTVLPGLIDLHTHFGSPDLEARQQPGPTTLPRMLLDTVRFAPAIAAPHFRRSASSGHPLSSTTDGP
jgi:hypothetical protein